MLRQHYRRWRRLLPLALLALLVAPGTWWREQPVPPGARAVLTVRPLAFHQSHDWPPGLRVVGSWVLHSRHQQFGGYSALVPLPDGQLLAYSDRGGFLRFTPPAEGSAALPGHVGIGQVPVDPRKRYLSFDHEAATHDPRTGRRWIAVETSNAIRRFDAAGRPDGALRPRPMRNWPANEGSEALVRLRDGRFIVLAEGKPGSTPPYSVGLLFAGDPVDEAQAETFLFPRQGRYRPTDMALLPDGRVLILQRSITLGLPPFGALLAVADPATIRQGQPWRWQMLAALAPPLPRENYEALAITPAPHGGVHLWIMSDDNQAGLQRTLLLQLHWSGR